MRMLKYLVQYRFRDMGELMRNEQRDPAPCEADLSGKTVVITGSTSGIGLETARLFASRGARLVVVNRDPAKAAGHQAELRSAHGCEVHSIIADFSSLDQVRSCAREIAALDWPLDVIIHNSGVYHTKKTLSADGIEMVFQVNHLSSFLLNHLLMDRLKAENRARIIQVNSEGHRFALGGVFTRDLHWRWHRYSGLRSYGAAKTAQILSMTRFKDLLEGTRVTINSMHPGNVSTNIGNNNGKIYKALKKKLVLSSAKDPVISAKALLWLAASPEMEGVTGKFFNLTTEERPAPHARDPKAVGPVWDVSMALCGLSQGRP